MKSKWKAIRTIINRKKTEQSTCCIQNKILGKHYSTVAENLAKNLPNISNDDVPSTSHNNHNKRHKNLKNIHNDFCFTKITEREIYENILKLDNTKGPGIDNFDVKILKSIADIISSHLCILFNLSIEKGLYPSSLKIAKCVPIFKGAPLDPMEPVNYRPISVLTSIDNVFEHCLHNQLIVYMETYNLLPFFQYGYRKNHNTTQAILDYTDFISKSCKSQLITIAIFMDLSKAFDTVDKAILQQKLISLGLSKDSIALLSSYMSERKFVMGKESESFELNYGVPQGSILGPLLFIMYTSDMTEITKNNKVIVYADDTTVLVTGRNLLEAKQHCNDILTRFYNYFTVNKLSINPTKTKYMIYKPDIRNKNAHKK